MKPLVVIPARRGSKGVPGKNKKLLNGKPLIQYTIEAAREVFHDEIICISTDDIDVKNIAVKLGLVVPFLRPMELAKDNIGMYDVLLHAYNFYKNNGYSPDTVVLLQATSPFRNSNHIQEALKIFDESCQMVVSVKESNSNPYYNLMEEDEAGWLSKSKSGNYLTSQECPTVYELNGAIYVIKVNDLLKKPLHKMKKVKKYVMSEEDSVDIDSNFDWHLAEFLINNVYKSTFN